MINDIFSTSFDEWFVNDIEFLQDENKLQSNLECESDSANDYKDEGMSDYIQDNSDFFECSDNPKMEYINETLSDNDIHINLEYSSECSFESINNFQPETGEELAEKELFFKSKNIKDEYLEYDENIDNQIQRKFDEIEADSPLNSSYSNTLNANIIKVMNAVGDGIAESVETTISASFETVSENILKARNKNFDNISESESIEVTNVIKPKLLFTLPSQHPYDLTKWIDSWLGQSLRLAELAQLGDVVNELQALKSRWYLPGFRLAVVGEFNRGKSTLINRLLNRCAVISGTFSTTAAFTSIITGSEDRMEVRFSSKHREVRPVEESSWNDLLATDSAGNEKEVFTGVQISLDHAWLRALDIELIDTPGTGDINGCRASVVFDLLNQSDAVIMVVSAITPFSMTEAAFLKERVMGRHIDRILVVVSHLDKIAKDQRPRLLGYIQGQVAKISKAIPVLPLHSVNDETEAFVLDVVRNQIATIVSKGDRRAWRSQQVAGQLADHLCNLVKIGEDAITSAHMNPVVREKALQKVQAEVQKAEFHWQKIQQQLDQRSRHCYQQLQEKILNAKAKLIEILVLELRQTNNLKLWWERELTFHLRREFPTIGRKSEDLLMRASTRDFEWLQSEVSHTFDIQMTWKPTKFSLSVNESLEINHNPKQLEIVDMQRYHLLTKIGISAAMLGGYIFGAPVGITTNLGMGIELLSETFLNKTLEEQRQIIIEKLNSIVDQAFDEHCQRVSERLQNLYRQLIDDTKRQQSIWNSAKHTAFQENGLAVSHETNLQQIIESASVLKAEIVTALQQYSV